MSDFRWTVEAENAFVVLWVDGASCSACANQLNTIFGGLLTRSAIAGKRRRMGLAERGSKDSDGRARKRKPRTRPIKEYIRTTVHGGLRLVETEVAEAVVSSLSPDDVPVTQRKQLLGLTMSDCRWPYGDPGKPDFFFCGGEIKRPNCSYCDYHFEVSRGRKASHYSDEERLVYGQKMARTRAQNKRKAA